MSISAKMSYDKSFSTILPHGNIPFALIFPFILLYYSYNYLKSILLTPKLNLIYTRGFHNPHLSNKLNSLSIFINSFKVDHRTSNFLFCRSSDIYMQHSWKAALFRIHYGDNFAHYCQGDPSSRMHSTAQWDILSVSHQADHVHLRRQLNHAPDLTFRFCPRLTQNSTRGPFTSTC